MINIENIIVITIDIMNVVRAMIEIDCNLEHKINSLKKLIKGGTPKFRSTKTAVNIIKFFKVDSKDLLKSILRLNLDSYIKVTKKNI